MTKVTRRAWIKRVSYATIGALSGYSGKRLFASVSSAHHEEFEEHVFDPGAPGEPLKFDRVQAERPLKIFSKGPKKKPEAFAKRLLSLSSEYADKNISRGSAPNQIDTFLELFGLHLKYENGAYVPFCAAGLSFAACRAYCELDPQNTYDLDDPLPVLKTILTDINKHYFKPSPAVRIVKADAQTRRIWVKQGDEKPKAGWPVIFSWKQNGVPNHIGLVHELKGGTLHTVEFNTSSGVAGSQSNGGAVARRQRKLSYVLGYVKTW
jgi:hypothetical protein